MADSNAAGGMNWVKGEIFANLRRARDSLEKLAEPGPESVQGSLGGAINALAEVRGMLSALQLVAPTRLTDELQRLCERLDAGQVSDVQEASEALMLALIQLPDYLDKVVAGQSVAPLALLPSINDLRVSGGDIPLSEAELLVPTSVLSEFDMPSADVQNAARAIAVEVRPQFHAFLLQWLRGESRDKGLANLGGLFHRFQECFGEGIFFDFFLVAEELVEALLEDRIAEDSKTKALIAHIDRIIKSLATDPRAWPEEQARTLFLELLSVMAKCKPCSYPVEELLTSYGLSEGTKQRRDMASPPISGPEPAAFDALTVEAKKELPSIRDALNSFARGHSAQAENEEPEALNEIRDDMAKAEGIVDELADGQTDYRRLGDTPDLLRKAAGAIRALSEGEAAEVLDLVAGQIEERFLEVTRTPQARELDLLAQAISGVDLYLVSKEEGATYGADLLLEARRAIETLRVEPSPTSTQIPERSPSGVTESDAEYFEPRDPPIPVATSQARDLDDVTENSTASETKAADREIVATAEACHIPLPQDPELIGSFLEGARDIVDRLDKNLRNLRLAPMEPGPLAEMQRSLHTLKGSARLSGLSPIGDLSHGLESLLGAVAHGEARVTDDTLDLTQRALDTLSDQIRAVGQRSDLQAADELVESLSLALEQGSPDPPEATLQADVVTAVPDGGAGPEEGPTTAFPSGPKSATFASGAAEAGVPRARVRADLIDHLLSKAGDLGIYCLRLAQQSAAANDRLEELGQAVDRLGGQLRKLEQETEAQILHSGERNAASLLPELEGFDPLGLDRFSALQQLSRSLDETAEDLAGLRTLLSDAQTESDTLLQRQARISDDLREGLLRTRMVPFTRAVPRLHRLVSQTAQQVGKEVRLEVSGPEVELDRDIHEHILAPLEHLLRNAVVHGIELPDQREQARKLPSGVISLSLSQDKNGVIIKVEDDGAGLNLQAIHKRALDRGLIAEDAQVSNEALTKLILQSGFSTVEEASQTAGRGIGLDVVSTEVERLSGSLDLETDPGHGTSFAIRLPHSLAIIEALLVRVGDQVFAIPNAAIEDTSRISRAALEACYRGEEKDLSHGGQDFRLMYLGSLLQLRGIPDLGDDPWLPVLLARFGEQRVAFQVDHLLGGQRILVKPVGPKRGDARWLSGESILPDDNLVLVLDLLGLMRSRDIQNDYLLRQPEPEEHKRRPCVMVVDDSLTVRRATSRMLQRHNMDVVTARDGIDALRRLEGRVPDVVVLDIEMPRMDGCELARQIRRSERLKDIPLIMISSRTGEKHRRHALDLGVDLYLGKPFQEMDLLDGISSMLAEASL